ncbi:MAG: O-antigen ligase family protein [Methylococcales bacterium]
MLDETKLENGLGLKGSPEKTNWALLLLIMLMPLRNIQIQYIPNFGGGLNIINILFLFALMHSLNNGIKIRSNDSLNKIIIIYIFTSIFSLILGYMFLGDAASGNWNHLKDQLIPVFLVFIIQKSAVDIVQWRRIMLAAIFPVIYCFRLVWNQYQSVASWHYSHDLRISGPFMDLGANELGAYAVTAGLISIACLITAWENKSWRYIFIVLVVASCGSLLYSYSRGGYLAFLIGLIFIFFRYKKSSKLLKPALIVIVLVLFNLPASVEERFSSISASEDGSRDESAESRFIFWEIAFERFQDKPLFGYGYHTVTDPRINPYQMDTHNYFIKVLVERGVFGTLILLALLLSLRKKIKRNLLWDTDDYLVNGVVLGMHGTFIALIIGNMFGDRFSHYPIVTIFWTYVGLIAVLETYREIKPVRFYH